MFKYYKPWEVKYRTGGEERERYQVESDLHGAIENYCLTLNEATKLAMKHKRLCCRNCDVYIRRVDNQRYDLVRSY